MTIKTETSLRDFEFWGHAKTVADKLTEKEIDTIEYELESIYPDGLDSTLLNDLFAFNTDFIASFIGETEESILERDD